MNIAVIVASAGAHSTVTESLARFREELDGRGEVVLVDASRDGTAGIDGVRVLRRPVGTLAPLLWSAGLEATDAPLIAFTTAAMVPRPGWLSALRNRLDSTGAAAVGGPIEPGAGLGPSDRALYLLRYVNYLRPMPESAEVEPAGDNALYRRKALRGLESLWERGFWEVEIHRALRARGERLAFAEGAAVEFAGGGPLVEALRQRLAHATHYGSSRAGRMGLWQRGARVLAAPAVPLVLLRRIAIALCEKGQALGAWTPALPPLSLLLAAWSFGEARGIWRAES